MNMMRIENKDLVDIHTKNANIYSALKNSVYPGAKDESVAMVLAYCNARELDPLQKPVHIVPMYIKDSSTGKGEMRDIVMPGIGLYRIQAQRSNCYAGQSDPEFGEDVTENLSGVTLTYPKWCKITVMKQMPNGAIVEFSAKEFWKENYATAGKDSTAPNAMWRKRPYAQLSKCAEAQALRKAFPDILDQSPTAEEMEGKSFDGEYIDQKPIKCEVTELNDKLGLATQTQQTYDMSVLCKKINEADSLDELATEYKAAYKLAKGNENHITILTEQKDKRKAEIQKVSDDFFNEFDKASGEIK